MKKVLIVAVALLATGCATKHGGRMPPLSEVERNTLTCREIQIEQAKVGGFFDGLKKSFEPGVMDVLAFFGDFGIGNVIEEREAVGSGQLRMGQLMSAYNAKGCGEVAQ